MLTAPLTLGDLAVALPQGSSIAPRVDAAFTGLLVASSLLVIALLALNLTFLIRYRRGAIVPRGPLRLPMWKIETGWISATTLVFLGFFAWGASVYMDMERPPANAMTIDVVGRQWMWDIRHPDGRREFDTLHVPLGQVIRLRLTSEDVIHSFFVPAFRIKQDVVPGKTVNAWFEATRKGSYHLFCAQYCGTKHAGMIGEVIVQSPEDYAAWLATGNSSGLIADRGRRLFLRYGCSGCHAPSSTVHAPPLEGIYGQRVPLEGGQLVQVDDAYLRDSILEPTKQIAAGYSAVMPSFKGVIPEGDLLELLNYIKSLASVNPAPTPAPLRP
jgi:cytochrome c oxidase subunit II